MKRRVDASLRGPDAADARREARPRRHPRGRVLRAGAAARPRRQGPAAARARHAPGARDARRAPATSSRARGRGLADAYRFLRDVEHKLQIVHERQTQLIPSDAEATARRWCGGSATSGRDGAAAFWRRARAAHGGRATRRSRRSSTAPRRSAGATSGPELTALSMDALEQEERALWRARARSASATSRARTATCGCCATGRRYAPASARRREALAALAPALLAEIARLRGARTARSTTWRASSPTVGARTSYLHLLLENPGVLPAAGAAVRDAASSCRTSSCAIPSCSTASCAPTSCACVRARDDLRARARTRTARGRRDFETELDTLRRFRTRGVPPHRRARHRGRARAPTRWRHSSPTSPSLPRGGARRSHGARSLRADSACRAEPPTEALAVLGMGKLGGAELNYAPISTSSSSTTPATGVVARAASRRTSSSRASRSARSACCRRRRARASRTASTRASARRATRGRWCRRSRRSRPTIATQRAAVGAPGARSRRGRSRGPPALRAAARADRRALRLRAWARRATRWPRSRRMRERIGHERGGGEDERGQHQDRPRRARRRRVRWCRCCSSGTGTPTPASASAGRATRSRRSQSSGILPADEARALRAGYDFLRALESRLRIERDQPVEALDTDPEALLALARRLGYEGADAEAVAALRADHDAPSRRDPRRVRYASSLRARRSDARLVCLRRRASG